MMRVVYNNGIHIRNVNTTFYDIGTNQYIIFLINKIQYPFFQFMSFELAVCKTDTQIGTKPLYHRTHFCQTLYTVMDKENLSAPFRFIINSIADKIIIECVNLGLNRLPVGGWCIDDAKITRPHQAKL